MNHSTRVTRRRAVGLAGLVAATVSSLTLGPVALASATTIVLQPTGVTVAQLNDYSGAGLDNLSNCSYATGTKNSSSSPGDYSYQNDTTEGTTIGDDSGGLSYNFGFPVGVNNFAVTITAPAPAEPAGVPRGVYGTTFPPESQHVDEATAQADYGCSASDFTVYNYEVGLTINGVNWLYAPDYVTNSAQNEVTLGVQLPGGSSTITAGVGVQNGGGPSGTVTYTCQNYCNVAAGEQVNISDLGSASGASLNLSNVTVSTVGYNTFTVNLATAVVGVSKGTGVVQTTNLANVTAMTIYVANVINPPAGNYPGFDYTVGVTDNDAGSTNIYSTVPAPTSTTQLTYTAQKGDPLTSSLSISTNSITATNVPAQGATVTATVRDQYWNPVSGDTVYVGVQQPLDGAIFTEPVSAGTGPGGLPTTASDGTVQYYAWGTKATSADLPAALFAQDTNPSNTFFFEEPQLTTVTEASGNGTTVTFSGENTFAPGQYINVSGLPVTDTGGDLPVGGAVISSTSTSFTVSETGVNGTSYGDGVASAGGLVATGLSMSNNGSVVTVTGPNSFSAGQVILLTGFSDPGYGPLPTSIGVVLSSGNDFFTAYLLWPFFGFLIPVIPTNAPATGGTALSDNQISAATVTAASGDGPDITYSSLNSFSAGQSVNIEGLSPNSFDITNQAIGNVNGDSFTVPVSSYVYGSSTGTGIATASGPETVSMAVKAAAPSPPSAGVSFSGVGSSVSSCSGGSPCSLSDPVNATVSVGNGSAGGLATVTVRLVDQFGNDDTDRAVELSPLQPSGVSESFKNLSITPLEPGNNSGPYNECDQGPAADLPGVSCTDANGTTSFLVSDTSAQTVSFEIVDVTDGYTMPTTDLPPIDAPNIPIVTFTTGPLDPNNSIVSVNGGTTANVPADGTTYGTVTVTLRDQFGNAEPGESVTLSGTTGSPVAITAASGNGSTVTFLAPGNTFSAGQTVSITGLNGPFDLTGATIASASSTQFTVNAAVSGVATGSGVATPGEHDQVCAVASATSPTCLIPAQPTTSDANGQAWFHVSDHYLESVTYTASANVQSLAAAGTPIVNYVTGQVSYANSSVTVSPSTVVGNGRGTATVTATIDDSGGHPLAGITVALNPNDSATVTAASSDATTVTYSASNDFTAGQIVNIVGLGTLSGSSLDLSGATIVSATSSSFTVTDPSVANSIALGSGTATLDYSNLTVVPPVGQTNANGQVSFAVTAGAFDSSLQLPLSVLVPVDVSPAPKNGTTPIPSPLTANITFTPTPTVTNVVAAPDPQSASVTSAVGDGTSVTYDVTYSSATPLYPGQIVTITGLGTASGATLNLANQRITTTTPTSFTITNSTVGTSSGTGVVSTATPVANGTDDEDLTATVLDGSNPTLDGIAGLSLELVTTGGGAPLATGTTNSVGQVTFVTSLAPGLALNVTYVVKDLSDGGRVVGTAAVTFVPAANEADESTVSVTPSATYTYDPAQEAAHADQQTATVTVTLIDPSGSPIVGNTVALTADSAPATPSLTATVDGGVSSGTSTGESTSDANGVATFEVTDTAPETVSFDVQDLTTSTSIAQAAFVTETFVLRPDEASESTIVASPSPVEADGHSVSTVTVHLINHSQPVAGSLVSLTQGSGNSIITTGDPVSNQQGVVTFSVSNLSVQSVVYEATDLTTSTTLDNDAIVAFTAPPGGSLRPSVTGIAPSSGPGSGGTLVTLTGTNLLSASAVDFGGIGSPTFSVNLAGTELTAYSPIPVAEGSVNVTVSGPGGTSLDTASDIFTYTSAPPLSVSAVSPAYGAYTGGTRVTIYGTGLEDALAVHFGSSDATFSVSDAGRALTVTAPAMSTSHIVAVAVVTAHGSSSTSASTTFTYLGQAPAPKLVAPAVTSLSPAKGPIAGGTTVAIHGSNFSAVSYVLFGKVRLTRFTLNHAGSVLSVRSPALRGAGAVNVVVVTHAGVSRTTRHDVFTYVKKASTTAHLTRRTT